ncbi:hypothetical protein DsansV1_C25g0188011 [Dioscorea sansibarensis]
MKGLSLIKWFFYTMMYVSRVFLAKGEAVLESNKQQSLSIQIFLHMVITHGASEKHGKSYLIFGSCLCSFSFRDLWRFPPVLYADQYLLYPFFLASDAVSRAINFVLFYCSVGVCQYWCPIKHVIRISLTICNIIKHNIIIYIFYQIHSPHCLMTIYFEQMEC